MMMAAVVVERVETESMQRLAPRYEMTDASTPLCSYFFFSYKKKEKKKLFSIRLGRRLRERFYLSVPSLFLAASSHVHT
jgi:hypothetical protein